MIRFSLTYFLFFLLLFQAYHGIGQETTITGKITDSKSGGPIPFANIIISGTSVGTTTDFGGYYKISTSLPGDSLTVSYIGYRSKAKPFSLGLSQVINFQLDEEVQEMEVLVFEAGENPAFPIMRRAARNKKELDKKNLQAYEYDSYNKIEIDLDNLSEDFKNSKLVSKIKAVIDSVDQIAGEDGQPVLPIFISESISKYYYRNNPELQKEHILKTKLTGIGIQDGTLVSQIIGSTFQEYNFYRNWLNIYEKEFVSPIADGWRYYYDVFLIDSMYIGDRFCYRIDIYPKRPQDLAFDGTIWIDKETYALKQIDVFVDRTTNLNFIEKIRIQQELEPTEEGQWIPVKSRILTDFGIMKEFGMGSGQQGVLAKFYTSNKNWVINQPYKPKFYNTTIELEPDANEMAEEYWEENRHDPLSKTEQNVYAMIDTLKDIPAVRTLTDIVTWFLNGYIEVGKIDFGPWPFTYAYNDIDPDSTLTEGGEGHRFRLGFRTNEYFSKKVELNGYVAYGTKDKEFKYQGGVGFILDRDRWTRLDFKYGRDIQQVGVSTDKFPGSIIFETYLRNTVQVSPFWEDKSSIWFEREFIKGFSQKIIFRHRQIDPIFNYAYLNEPELGSESTLSETFSVSEIGFISRLGRDELWVINDNERVSLGSIKKPVFRLGYFLGINNLLGSDFNYHRLQFSVGQHLKMGFLGVSSYDITAGKVFGQVPYILLEGHIGNESIFYIPVAFNLMDFFEFVSDEWVHLRYQHQFEGYILNKVPLLKKLKWRLVGTANVLYGGVRTENIVINSPVDTNGNPTLQFNALSNSPYVEVGYGIENIFKLFRVDAFHRLTYRDVPGVNNFGVKFTIQFIF